MGGYDDPDYWNQLGGLLSGPGGPLEVRGLGAQSVGGLGGVHSVVPRGGVAPVAMKAKQKAVKIKNMKGELIDAPRSFFRGTNPGDKRRIKTGAKEWDSNLFVADNEDDAGMYGRSIQKFEATQDAKILYEGTAEWRSVAGVQRKGENLLQYADRAAQAAKAAGYDAAWFKRQGTVGTAIFNTDKFGVK